MPWFIITWRWEYDDEDSVSIIQAADKETAIAQKYQELEAAREDDFDTRAIYVNIVVRTNGDKPVVEQE